MGRYLLTVLPGLAEGEKEKIRCAAHKHGFTPMFYNSPQEAADMIPKAEIIFGNDGKLADNAPSLKWLCTSTAGVNQFMNKEVFTGGQAMLTNSSGAYGVTISEHVIMILLEILRRQQDHTQIISRKDWVRNLPVRSICESRITLLGTGDIGQETAIRLRSFSPGSLIGVNRSGSNPKGLFDRIVKNEDLETILPQTDILIMSLPGTAATEGMIGEKELAMLPDKAVVVNVGRGSVIVQSALEKELRKGRLSAALDVFEVEPIPQEDTIWTCPNLLITPHVAGNMTLPYTVRRIVDMFLENLDSYMEGSDLKHRVNLEKGY